MVFIINVFDFLPQFRQLTINIGHITLMSLEFVIIIRCTELNLLEQKLLLANIFSVVPVVLFFLLIKSNFIDCFGFYAELHVKNILLHAFQALFEKSILKPQLVHFLIKHLLFLNKLLVNPFLKVLILTDHTNPPGFLGHGRT